MKSPSGVVPAVLVGVLLGCMALPLQAQRIPFEKRFFNEQVLRPNSQPVVPIYEGYYENDDGTYDICFGYFNLNLDEPLEIPLGERNSIEPSQYDGRQPTHFTVVPGMTPTSPFTSRFRRIWCAFTVTVPATFTEDDQVLWTLQPEGYDPIRTPGTINIAYVLDEPTTSGRGDVAPFLRFSENGAEFQGRRGMTAPPRTVRVGQPLELSVWMEHRHPTETALWVGWVKYQGPGSVTFGPAEQRIQLNDQRGVARTTATFSEPGEYEVLVQAINTTASFEFHCCWTNGYISVNVTE
jgi:hypothetical protein